MGAADILANFDITFADNQNYVAVANGVLNPATFAANPDGISTAFTLFSASTNASWSVGIDFVLISSAR